MSHQAQATAHGYNIQVILEPNHAASLGTSGSLGTQWGVFPVSYRYLTFFCLEFTGIGKWYTKWYVSHSDYMLSQPF